MPRPAVSSEGFQDSDPLWDVTQKRNLLGLGTGSGTDKVLSAVQMSTRLSCRHIGVLWFNVMSS